MSATPDSTLANPEERIADLERQLAEREAELAEALQRETATGEVLQVINSSPGDLAPVFEAILEKARAVCGFAHGSLNVYDGDYFRTVAMHGYPEAFAELLRQPRRTGPQARFLEGDRIVHITDVAAEGSGSDDPVYRAAIEAGVRTVLFVPLRNDRDLLGYLTANRREARPFSEKEIALLENFAAQAVIAMENARLLTETREALEQQTATAEVLRTIANSPADVERALDTIAQVTSRLFDASNVNIRRLDGDILRYAATFGLGAAEFRAGAPEAPVDPRSLPGYAIIEKRQISIDDVRDPVVREHFPSAALVGSSRTRVATPLLREGRATGAIVTTRNDVRPFTEKELAQLRNFADQAVVAMENARLITETREALAQQTATAEVLHVINSSPGDLAPVFDAILEKAHKLCGVSHGSLQLYEDGRFRAVATRGVTAEVASFLRQPREPGLVGERLLAGARFHEIADQADGVAQSTSPSQSGRIDWREQGIVRRLFVPLRHDTSLLGMIVAGRVEVRPFLDKEISLLENFAQQAVIAMENARLLGELQRRTEEVAELNRGLEARVAEQVEELGRVGRLKRFLAPQLAELIVSQGDEKILESHRREIVVVFCDLRGYTAFTETAEPEEVLDFLREYHGALGPLVSQFEGTLDQFSGDGIMVFFNDPVPCPDPAERGVKMAMAMREEAGKLIADWRERGRDLGFVAGIAQGYATLGQIGFSERSGYTAIGTVCNVAARLCAEAKDGQILLSQRVNVALRGSVATEQVGALALKGLTQPVVAYNVPLVGSQAAFRVIEGGAPSA
jgi:class 3 adenylate cyclase